MKFLNSANKTLLAAYLVLLGVCLSGNALAETAAVTTDAAPTAAQPQPPAKKDKARKGGGAKHFQQLHQQLKLTPEQEAGWTTWLLKVEQARQQHKPSPADRQAMQGLPTPERLEKQLQIMKGRQAMLEASLEATRPFYQSLTPDQRKTFDDMSLFGGKSKKKQADNNPAED